MEKYPINISAPNLVNVCVDESLQTVSLLSERPADVFQSRAATQDNGKILR